MVIHRWFTVLRLKNAWAKRVQEDLNQAKDDVHRLEIALRRTVEKVAELEGMHAKLRSAFHGERGAAISAGRPAKRKDPNQPLPLEEIPVGDKAALRRHFGVVK